MEELVSIVTPVYNGEAFLPDAAKSVLGQTWSDWEWVIVDDASQDRSFDIAKALEEEDARIRTARLAVNRGAAVARNRAIEMARGRFIAFLDCDDLWKSEKLQKQVGFMLQGKIGLSYSYYEVIDETGASLGNAQEESHRLPDGDVRFQTPGETVHARIPKETGLRAMAANSEAG